jgi:hypothetical protein
VNDLYTKTVLSIIAAALLALVAQNAVHSSQAHPGLQKVQICDTRNCADVSLYPGAGWGLAVLPLSKP